MENKGDRLDKDDCNNESQHKQNAAQDPSNFGEHFIQTLFLTKELFRCAANNAGNACALTGLKQNNCNQTKADQYIKDHQKDCHLDTS